MNGYFFYLCTYPDVYRKLQKIVDDIFPDGIAEYKWDKIQNVPYIDAIINETLRLQPPAPEGLKRLTPPEGITVGDVYVPGDVVISVPIYALHRDPKYWAKAESFIPERWTDQPELCIDKRAYMPFTLGRNPCLSSAHIC